MINLNDYEILVEEIQKSVPIIEKELYANTGCFGLYRNGRIYIEQTLELKRKKEILAEEYAHYKTSVGEIINQNSTEARKQENKARNYSYDILVSLDDLIACSEAGLNTHYDCAEFLNVSNNTLKKVFSYYQQKYGYTYFYKGRIFEFRDSSVMILNTGLLQNL
ncbi:phage protein [Enterococcus silesiacus]|uniref:Phage protein n=1 Tax=Enterococcus silesiacus TaxID=332949 RepID=A0AA91GGN9_9ENTE|nr:phage protein [Enterococcus silesiacus]